jgi:hypothetical protein
VRRRGTCALLVLIAAVAAACTADPSPSPSAGAASATPAATATGVATREPSPSATAAATVEATPAPTSAPSLSLELPDGADSRVVAVEVSPQVPADGDGRLVVTVTSAADERIDELVLRWPTELDETLFLAPFTPSPDRIVEGGNPLVQPWTKWVIGPGEQDEPEGTTSVGWGPLLPGATLEIPLIATRVGDGPVEFDLQVLAGNDILALDGGKPAVLRVEVP